jgi:hypothetical protein
LQKAYQIYLGQLRGNLTRTTNSVDGVIVLRVAPFPAAIDQIEATLWNSAREILDTRQLEWLRLNLRTRPAALLDAVPLEAVQASVPWEHRGLFAIGDLSLELEYREVDGWYHWRVYDPAVNPERQPPLDKPASVSRELPEPYRTLVELQ